MLHEVDGGDLVWSKPLVWAVRVFYTVHTVIPAADGLLHTKGGRASEVGGYT